MEAILTRNFSQYSSEVPWHLGFALELHLYSIIRLESDLRLLLQVAVLRDLEAQAPVSTFRLHVRSVCCLETLPALPIRTHFRSVNAH